MKHGTYCGGVRCLETLRDRCRIDADTGCWHWALAMSQGQPRVHYLSPDGGEHRIARGRYAAIHLSSGKKPAEGVFAFARIGCKSKDCVNPGHARTGDRMQMCETMRRAGRTVPTAVKRAAITQMVRSCARTKLSMEKARAIRASDQTSRELAELYGIAKSQIDAVKAGTAWRETLLGVSVFALGAR